MQNSEIPKTEVDGKVWYSISTAVCLAKIGGPLVHLFDALSYTAQVCNVTQNNISYTILCDHLCHGYNSAWRSI